MLVVLLLVLLWFDYVCKYAGIVTCSFGCLVVWFSLCVWVGLFVYCWLAGFWVCVVVIVGCGCCFSCVIALLALAVLIVFVVLYCWLLWLLFGLLCCLLVGWVLLWFSVFGHVWFVPLFVCFLCLFVLIWFELLVFCLCFADLSLLCVYGWLPVVRFCVYYCWWIVMLFCCLGWTLVCVLVVLFGCRNVKVVRFVCCFACWLMDGAGWLFWSWFMFCCDGLDLF